MILDEICKNNKVLSRKENTGGGGLLLFGGNHRNPVVRNGAAWQLKREAARKSCKATLAEAVDRYSNQTTIHGMDRLCSMSLGKKQRLFWFVIFVAALMGCVYASIVIAERYNARNFRTLIDQTKFPVFKIPFPEVTICNHNRLNWQRLGGAQRRFLRKQHRTPRFRSLFVRILTAYDELSFGGFSKFEGLLEESPALLRQLNYVNMSHVVDFMSWRCREILEQCSWRERPVDCCDVFLKRRSQLGQCLAFNTVEGEVGRRMLSSDPLWPWRTVKSGPKTGLMVRVKLREDSKHQNNKTDWKGLTMMLAEPFAYFSDKIHVPQNTKTSISIDAELNFYDEYTRGVSSSERECVFPDEVSSQYPSLKNHKYMLENCISECQQRYLLKFCNCTMDLFYPPAGYPSCQVVDLPCLARNNHLLIHMEETGEEEYVTTSNTSMSCKCLQSCLSLTYIYAERSSPLPVTMPVPPQGRNVSSPAVVAAVELDIYFYNDFLIVYKTSLSYTWVDSLVSFGSIVALFLGCSVVSLVELVYFQLFDLPRSLLLQHRQL